MNLNQNKCRNCYSKISTSSYKQFNFDSLLTKKKVTQILTFPQEETKKNLFNVFQEQKPICHRNQKIIRSTNQSKPKTLANPFAKTASYLLGRVKGTSKFVGEITSRDVVHRLPRPAPPTPAKILHNPDHGDVLLSLVAGIIIPLAG